MTKVRWDVIELAISRAPRKKEVDVNVAELLGRLGCKGIQSLVFDFGKIDQSVVVWIRLLNEIGLMVRERKSIGSGYQLKLTCGIALNFYTTGTLMAQGRYRGDQVGAIESLRAVLESLKSFSQLGLAKSEGAYSGEEF